MLGLNWNYTQLKWISHFLFSASTTPTCCVCTSRLTRDQTVPSHCVGLSATACLFTSCCQRGSSTYRTGLSLRMSFCLIPINQLRCAREPFCVVVLHSEHHLVPFVQQDNTAFEKEQDIVSVVSSSVGLLLLFFNSLLISVWKNFTSNHPCVLN